LKNGKTKVSSGQISVADAYVHEKYIKQLPPPEEITEEWLKERLKKTLAIKRGKAHFYKWGIQKLKFFPLKINHF